MGRKPKSLKELELSGALKARPGRYKKRLEAAKASATVEQNAIIVSAPAKPAPLGSAPKHLSADEKAIWKELTKTYPNLIFSDRFHLEIATKLTHKLRTAEGGLKGQEYSQLLGILDKFAGPTASIKNEISHGTAPGKARNTFDETVKSDSKPVPVEDTRTPQEIEREKGWLDFIAEDEENKRRDKVVGEEVRRRLQTVIEPDHLNEAHKAHWRWKFAHDIRMELFEDEREIQRRQDEMIERYRATHKDEPKPKEPEKVEYNLTPTPRPEPFVEDPARKREQMLRRWSM